MTIPRSIDAYENYAEFLKAKYAYLKSKKRQFSHVYCAKKIGSTPSYLKNVLEGRRKIGLSRISKISALFELNPFESQYFTLLVIRDLISDLETKKFFDLGLASLKFNQHHLGDYTRKLPVNHHSFPLTNWLYAAILELMRFPDFKGDADWIRSQLIDGAHLSNQEVESAIQDLISQKFIQKNELSFTITQATLSTPATFDSTGLIDYRGLVEKTWQVLEKAALYKKNHFFQMMVRLSEAQELKVFQATEKYRDEIMGIVSKPEGCERLVAISTSVFNLLK